MNRGSEVDQATLRAAFGCFPSGVAAVCAVSVEGPIGMAASSFTSVSLAPPLVSVCVAHSSRTWPRLAELPTVGVSVLAEGQAQVATALSARSGDRFGSVEWLATASGSVLVKGAALWLECVVHDRLSAGDHDIVVLRVLELDPYPDVLPIVFHGSRYRHLAPST